MKTPLAIHVVAAVASAKVPPLWGDVSVLGLVGYVLRRIRNVYLARHGRVVWRQCTAD